MNFLIFVLYYNVTNKMNVMNIEDVNKCYDYCTEYLDRLNHNQINALYKYLKMKFKDCDMLVTAGRVACLHVLVWLRTQAKDENTDENFFIWQKLIDVGTFMLGMLMVQDEYNKYNPNYKSILK